MFKSLSFIISNPYSCLWITPPKNKDLFKGLCLRVYPLLYQILIVVYGLSFIIQNPCSC